MSDSAFDELKQALDADGAAALLRRLVNRLRDERKYHELFEALLLRARHRLGLPIIVVGSLEDLPEDQRSQVEDAYLVACREVGSLLLKAGDVRGAWMYLRPVGDKALVAAGLAEITPDEDNIADIVEVAVHEGMAIGLGFQLMIEHYGVCNAISTFESSVAGRPRVEQQLPAALLVRHLYDDLLANLRADIRRQEGAQPPEASVAELIADRDWLFANHNYHIDTSHLAATVRYARVLDDPQDLAKAIELTEYGRRLSSQFQFAGDEPFVDLYATHGLLLRALRGEQVEQALEFFASRTAASETNADTAAAETYVNLLGRVGRQEEAVAAAARLLPLKARPYRTAPSLMELAQVAGSYEPLLAAAREKDDLVTYATGLLAAVQGRGT